MLDNLSKLHDILSGYPRRNSVKIRVYRTIDAILSFIQLYIGDV
jgi:hypothetical protein